MKYIKTIKEDKALIIYLNRPEALNALNNDMIVEVGKALSEVNNDPEVAGIIITGEGEKAFAAGADIKGFPSLDESKAKVLSRSGHDVFNQIERFNKPVIAAINGYALGGGLELAMACHMRIANHEAQFAMPEVKLGLIPGYGGTQRLAKLIGKPKAMEYILTANMMNAEEAHRLGLVNAVVESSGLLEHAKQWIKTISKRGPSAVEQAIRLINRSDDQDGDPYEDEINTFAKLMVSEESREGVSAFIEKRKPSFTKG